MNNTTPYADLIDYNLLFEGMSKRGIILSDEDKEEFEKICRHRFNMHDSNSFASSGTSLIQNIIYSIFAFVKGGFKDLDFNNLTGSLGDIAENTNEKRKLFDLNQATMGICRDFMEKGGKFAAAAELVTGQRITSLADSTTPAENMPGNIFGQLQSNIALPPGTNSSLNNVPTRS